MKQLQIPILTYIDVTVKELDITTTALIDTGSEVTFFQDFLLPTWDKLPSNNKIRIKGVHPIPTYLDLVQHNVSIILGNKILTIPTVLQYNSGYDILLGNDFLKQFAKFTQTPYTVYLTTKCGHTLKIPTLKQPYRVRAKRGGHGYEQIALQTQVQKPTFTVNIIKKDDLLAKLKQICSENPLQFWKPEHPRAKIELTQEIYIKEKPMLYSEEDIKEFSVQMKELLEKGLIRPANGAYSSPAFMVFNEAEKRRGKARMVINYKKLNQFTKTDNYFLPNKEVLINLVKNKKYFSKFDCKSGFWQIKMEETSIKYTGFSTPQGFYEWIVMPFGLKNAPRIFQRRMDNAFKHLNHFLVVYVDDILISSDTLEEHRTHLNTFLETAIKEGICLSERKAVIEKEKIEFLGFEVGTNGISLQPHISRKITEYPDQLRTKKQIQGFLGLLNYASSYIPDLARKKKDLQSLLRKNNTLGWTDKHTEIVRKLKEECQQLPSLRLPEPEDNLILQTDASDKTWAAVLKTDLNEICGYHSGTFSEREENYNTMEKELLAIIRGITKWRLFLLPKPFKVLTDNQAATTFVKQALDNGPHMRKLHRWQLFLSQFNATYEHVAGKNNFIADYLTREHEYYGQGQISNGTTGQRPADSQL